MYSSRSRTKATKIDWINIKVLSYAFGGGGAESVCCCHITRRLRKRDVHICALHTVHKIQTECRMLCHWESGELPWHLLIADCTVSRCFLIRFGVSVADMCACVWQPNNDAAPSASCEQEWTEERRKKTNFPCPKSADTNSPHHGSSERHCRLQCDRPRCPLYVCACMCVFVRIGCFTPEYLERNKPQV